MKRQRRLIAHSCEILETWITEEEEKPFLTISNKTEMNKKAERTMGGHILSLSLLSSSKTTYSVAK